MRALILALLMALVSGATHAEEGSCSARSAEKKLSGAAKASFMKKCSRDAQAACEVAATEKKLAGAARASFVKKCTGDAVGN